MKQFQLTKIHEFMRAVYWDRLDKTDACSDYTDDEVWEMCEWIRDDLRIISGIRNME